MLSSPITDLKTLLRDSFCVSVNLRDEYESILLAFQAFSLLFTTFRRSQIAKMATVCEEWDIYCQGPVRNLSSAEDVSNASSTSTSSSSTSGVAQPTSRTAASPPTTPLRPTTTSQTVYYPDLTDSQVSACFLYKQSVKTYLFILFSFTSNDYHLHLESAKDLN